MQKMMSHYSTHSYTTTTTHTNKAAPGSSTNDWTPMRVRLLPVPSFPRTANSTPKKVKRVLTQEELAALIAAGEAKRQERRLRKVVPSADEEEVSVSITTKNRTTESKEQKDLVVNSTCDKAKKPSSEQQKPRVLVIYPFWAEQLVKRIDPYYRSKHEQFTIASIEGWVVIAAAQVLEEKDKSQLPTCHCKSHHPIYRPLWVYNAAQNRICSMSASCLQRLGMPKEELSRVRRGLRSCIQCKRYLPATSLPNRMCEGCHLQVGKLFNDYGSEQIACVQCFRYNKIYVLEQCHNGTLTVAPIKSCLCGTPVV
jgi:hypothetical protein